MPVAWSGDGVRSDPDIVDGGRDTTRAVSGYSETPPGQGGDFSPI